MFSDCCVMSRVESKEEGGLKETGRDNMGGKTGSVDRGEGWLGECEVERGRDERIKRGQD